MILPPVSEKISYIEETPSFLPQICVCQPPNPCTLPPENFYYIHMENFLRKMVPVGCAPQILFLCFLNLKKIVI